MNKNVMLIKKIIGMGHGPGGNDDSQNRRIHGSLKNLKMNQKHRRKLNIFIQQGASFGELIFELSGNSPYSGVLTTIFGDGEI